jgi:hypothetical protein
MDPFEIWWMNASEGERNVDLCYEYHMYFLHTGLVGYYVFYEKITINFVKENMRYMTYKLYH